MFCRNRHDVELATQQLTVCHSFLKNMHDNNQEKLMPIQLLTFLYRYCLESVLLQVLHPPFLDHNSLFQKLDCCCRHFFMKKTTHLEIRLRLHSSYVYILGTFIYARMTHLCRCLIICSLLSFFIVLFVKMKMNNVVLLSS